ncbi:MAG: transposase [Candidatus Lokiarchaeota archaeon]|nr:transposase [Candidatus Lokiarchaeota archaeon]
MQYKCEEFKIDLILTVESHTFSTYQICNKNETPNDRIFRCSHWGYEQDRDVVGSINILKRHIHDHQIDKGRELSCSI